MKNSKITRVWITLLLLILISLAYEEATTYFILIVINHKSTSFGLGYLEICKYEFMSCDLLIIRYFFSQLRMLC